MLNIWEQAETLVYLKTPQVISMHSQGWNHCKKEEAIEIKSIFPLTVIIFFYYVEQPEMVEKN